MKLLEMRGATVEERGRRIAGPFDVDVDEGAPQAFIAGSAQAARIAAMLACGMIRASSGSVYVGAFDARIQPVQVKRLAAYVPYEPFTPAFGSFTRYIEYRADLWGVPRDEAVIRARAVLEKLYGMHEAFAYPIAGALCAAPKLLVLDRPSVVHAQRISHAASACTVLSCHVSAGDARAYTQAEVTA